MMPLSKLLCLLSLCAAAIVFCFYLYGKREGEADLVLASGQKGGLYLELAHEVAAVLEANQPGLSITVLETTGSGENARLVEEGKADLALIQNDTVAANEIRVIGPTHREFLHLVARKDSRIRSWEDFRGKRIVTGPESSGAHRIIVALLDYFSLLDQVELVPMEYEQARLQLLEGEADVLPLMFGFRVPFVQNLFSESEALELVPLKTADAEALNGFVSSYPAALPVSLPPFSYGTIPSRTLETVGVETLLITSSRLPEPLVRKITETLFSHRSQIVKLVPQASHLREGFPREHVSFPIHRGAAAFFDRNQPGFFVKYAETMAFGLSVLLAVYSLIATARSWMRQHRKDRIDAYYLRLEENLTVLRSAEPLAEEKRKTIEDSIRDVRHEAFLQLADEKLKPDASFRILQHLLEECDAAIKGRAADD